MPFTREIPKQGWESFLHTFSVEEEGDGRSIALAIESEEEGKTLLIFEREAALPAGG